MNINVWHTWRSPNAFQQFYTDCYIFDVLALSRRTISITFMTRMENKCKLESLHGDNNEINGKLCSQLSEPWDAEECQWSLKQLKYDLNVES